MDDCVGEPCQNDGTCDDLHYGFSCRCLPGFTGKFCSEVVNVNDDNVADTNLTISTSVFCEPLEYQPSEQVGSACISRAHMLLAHQRYIHGSGPLWVRSGRVRILSSCNETDRDKVRLTESYRVYKQLIIYCILYIQDKIMV